MKKRVIALMSALLISIPICISADAATTPFICQPDLKGIAGSYNAQTGNIQASNAQFYRYNSNSTAEYTNGYNAQTDTYDNALGTEDGYYLKISNKEGHAANSQPYFFKLNDGAYGGYSYGKMHMQYYIRAQKNDEPVSIGGTGFCQIHTGLLNTSDQTKNAAYLRLIARSEDELYFNVGINSGSGFPAECMVDIDGIEFDKWYKCCVDIDITNLKTTVMITETKTGNIIGKFERDLDGSIVKAACGNLDTWSLYSCADMSFQDMRIEHEVFVPGSVTTGSTEDYYTASVDITNDVVAEDDSVPDNSPVLAIAVYDAKGRLQNISISSEKTICKNTADRKQKGTPVTVSVQAPKTDRSTAKVFIWKNIMDKTPYIDPITISD